MCVSLGKFGPHFPDQPLSHSSRSIWAVGDILLKRWKVEVKPLPSCAQKVGAERVVLYQRTCVAAPAHLRCCLCPGSPCWHQQQLGHSSSSSHWISSSSCPDSGPHECSALPAGSPLPSKLETWRDKQLMQIPVRPSAYSCKFKFLFVSPALCPSSFPRCLLSGHQNQTWKRVFMQSTEFGTRSNSR